MIAHSSVRQHQQLADKGIGKTGIPAICTRLFLDCQNPLGPRNRVRRRLREIVRKHQHEILKGKWIVTIARASAAKASYEQLEGEWLRLAKRASILAA